MATEADTPEGLVPFTRWITPPGAPMKKRFSVQLYVYMLPLNEPLPDTAHDGGLEHTEAEWADVAEWVRRAQAGEVMLYEPQAFPLHVMAPFFPQGPNRDYGAERKRLLEFIRTVPTGDTGHFTDQIPWKDKIMCPYVVGQVDDGRVIISCEHPGPEIKDEEHRGGCAERMVMINTWTHNPRNAEMVRRKDAKYNPIANASPKM